MEFIYLFHRFRNSFSLHQSNVFYHCYVFFYLLDIELQRNASARVRTQYFDSSTVYTWKVVHIQKTEPPVAINIIYLSVPELENSVFMDLVLLRFTAAASYSFCCPSWWSTANCSSGTLSCSRFWIFLPSGIQSGEETDVGRQRLNLSWLSLFSFSELNKALDANEKTTNEGFWFSFHKNYKLGPNYPRLAISYWSRLTALTLIWLLWDVKEPTPLFEKSRGRRPRCCGHTTSFTSWVGWVQ